MKPWLCTLALVALGACASPQERCVLDVTHELRTVDVLIAETEANLARGYAYDTTVERRPRLTFCAGSYRSHFGLSFCRDTDLVYRDRPVAIDPQAEQRKLAILSARKKNLEVSTEAGLAECRALG